MPKFYAENERIKRQYLTYLRQAKGQDETSLDKVAAALRMLRAAPARSPSRRSTSSRRTGSRPISTRNATAVPASR